MMFFTFADPMYKDIEVLRSDRDSLNSDLESLRELAKVRDELLIQYNTISRSDHERLNKMFPREVASDQLMVEINQLASQNGLLFKGIDIAEVAAFSANRGRTPEQTTILNGVQSPQLSFNVSGTYQGFRLFLEDLESHIRITDMMGISFGAPTVANESIDVVIKGMSYWEK